MPLTLDLLEPSLEDTQEDQDLSPQETPGEGTPQEEETQREETEVEGKESEEETGETASEKQPYTSEELEEILSTDGEVDKTRLSLEGQALMKSFQRVFTKKSQGLSEERKAFSQEKENLKLEQLKKENPDEYLYQQYTRNPNKVISEINAEIEKLELSDPHDPDNRKIILRLNQAKDKLFLRSQHEVKFQKEVNELVTETREKIIEAIPNFKEKQVVLSEFAEGLGLSMQEQAILTDPVYTGPLAAKITILLNKVYDMVNAASSAKKKEVKPNANKLGKAGATRDKTKTNTENLSYEEYRKKRSKGEI